MQHTDLQGNREQISSKKEKRNKRKYNNFHHALESPLYYMNEMEQEEILLLLSPERGLTSLQHVTSYNFGHI